jgi:hypothetical protein
MERCERCKDLEMEETTFFFRVASAFSWKMNNMKGLDYKLQEIEYACDHVN